MRASLLHDHRALLHHEHRLLRRRDVLEHVTGHGDDVRHLAGFERSNFRVDAQQLRRFARARQQRRPTPLLLRYVEGDYNCLHQDLYGAEWFPLQVIVLLNAPEQDFAGGELLIVEQRPRAQSKGSVIPLQQGDAAVIAVNHRPRRGARGYSRVTLRHGVSTLTRGRRHTLGIIFHDAA